MTDLPQPKMIIFDCDGTLVNTEVLHMQVMHEILTEHGVNLSLEEVSALCTGITITKSFEAVRALGYDLAPDIDKEYKNHFQGRLLALGDGLTIEGALETAVACAARYPIAVATNGEVSFTDTKLRAAGFFTAMPDLKVYTKDLVARPKPAPDLFLHVAAEFGVAPQECWVVEDSIPGVTAGIAAGMTVIGFTGCAHNKAQSALDLTTAGAALIVEDYSQFPLAF